MKQKTKSIQLDPAVLTKLMELKQKTGAHSVSEVVATLIEGNRNSQSLESRVKRLEQKIKEFEQGDK